MAEGAGKSIIFCATQRTGSGMIFDDFRNLAGYPAGGSEILYNRIIVENAPQPWASVWKRACQTGTVGEYFVDKVMFHYVPKLSKFMAGGSIGEARRGFRFSPEAFDTFHEFFRDAVWVHIRRNDVFAQAVSMYLAEMTKVWYRWSHQPAPEPTPADIPYDFTRIKNHFRGFITESEQWLRFFDHYRIRPILIEYEEAVDAYPGYLSPLFQELDLQMVDQPRERRVLKTGDAVNEKFLSRFRSDILLELYKTSNKDL